MSNKKIIGMSVFCLVLAVCSGVVYAPGISSCPYTINAGGNYWLTGPLNQTGAGICINIAADDVDLDCNSFSIDGDSSSGFGIYVYGYDNINISGCNISDFDSGIYFEDVSDSLIENTHVSDCTRGIEFDEDTYRNTISNVEVYDNNRGLDQHYLRTGDLEIRDSKFYRNGAGLNIEGIVNASIYNSNFTDNRRGIFIGGRNVQISDINFLNNGLDLHIDEGNNHCEFFLNNVNASDGNEIIVYRDTALNFQDMEFPELILCNSDNSILRNIKTDALYVSNTDFSVFDTINISSTDNITGGLDISNSNNNDIFNLYVEESIRYGLYTQGVDNNFENISVYGGGFGGIYLRDGTSRNNFTNVISSDNSGRGIEVRNSATDNIFDNLVVNGNTWGLWIRGDRNIFKNLEVNNNFFEGIYLPDGQDNEFINFTANYNGRGIKLSFWTTGNKFINGNVSYNDDGLIIGGTVVNNIISDTSFCFNTADDVRCNNVQAQFFNNFCDGGGASCGGVCIPCRDYVDIGLRIFDGTEIVSIAAEPLGTLTSPLRIGKNGNTYGIVLVDPSDPLASKIRISTNSGIKALKRIGGVCGDGNIDAGETCDDNNIIDCDGCKGDCSRPDNVCGDNIMECGEGCDDGNGDNSDACPDGVSGTCRPAFCGDSFIYIAGAEFCDDGGTSECAPCNADCSGPGVGSICGDGFVCGPEVCDDNNVINCDGCYGDCTRLDNVCGDSIMECGEVCERTGSQCAASAGFYYSNYIEDGITCNGEYACSIGCSSCISQAVCDGGGPSSHWQEVDDVVADDNVTKVWTDSATTQKDFYELTDPVGILGTETIYWIRIRARARGVVSYHVILDSVETQFGTTTVTSNWGSHTGGPYENRTGGGNWTWNDMRDFQVGIGLKTLTFWGTTYQGRVTQVYVEVDYDGGTLILRPNADGDYINIDNP